MKNLSTKAILAIGIISTGVFASCSRQMESISRTNKLMNTETLTAKNVQPKHEAITSPKVMAENKVIENTDNASDLKKESTLLKPKLINKAKTFVHALPTMASNVVKKQISATQDFAVNHRLASYSEVHKTQGMLGVAGLCLITAIALAVLGLVQAGNIFYIIAVVMLIAAGVFFLLYLIGKAAGPETE